MSFQNTPLSDLMDQVSALTGSGVNFADRAGVTAIPGLGLRPEQTMHHSPVCLWAKQQGGFPLCSRQKDRSLQAVSARQHAVSGICPHGLWDLAWPVYCQGRLVGVFYGGGWTRGAPVQPKTERPWKGKPPPAHTAKNEERLRKHLAMLADVMVTYLDRARAEGVWPRAHRTPAQVVAAVEDLLRTRYPEDLTVESVAAELSVNAHHLGQVIRTVTGRGFRQCLLEKRLHAAKGLLPMRLSVREVASRVGFGDPNYFTAVFTKAEGCPPRAWVREHRGTG